MNQFNSGPNTSDPIPPTAAMIVRKVREDYEIQLNMLRNEVESRNIYIEQLQKEIEDVKNVCNMPSTAFQKDTPTINPSHNDFGLQYGRVQTGGVFSK